MGLVRMGCCWIRTGPRSNMPGVFIRRKKRHRHREADLVRTETQIAPISQGWLVATGARREAGEGSSEGRGTADTWLWDL